MFHPETGVAAILDWELSTLGNPLADLAYFCMSLRLPAGGYIPGLAGQDRAAVGLPDEARPESACRLCSCRVTAEPWRRS